MYVVSMRIVIRISKNHPSRFDYVVILSHVAVYRNGFSIWFTVTYATIWLYTKTDWFIQKPYTQTDSVNPYMYETITSESIKSVSKMNINKYCTYAK